MGWHLFCLVHPVKMANVNASIVDDGFQTDTSNAQEAAELACRDVFEEWLEADGSLSRDSVSLSKAAHAQYLNAGLHNLPGSYSSLDASRPWLCYWIVHSLEILGRPYAVAPEEGDHVVDFLARCQDPQGGFCGGPHPGQAPHLAPTYAAVNALVTIGTEKAYRAINRKGLSQFLLRMKTAEGGVHTHTPHHSMPKPTKHRLPKHHYPPFPDLPPNPSRPRSNPFNPAPSPTTDQTLPKQPRPTHPNPT